MTETPMAPVGKRVDAYLAARATADHDIGNQIHAFNGHSLTEDDLRGLLVELAHERAEIAKLRNLVTLLDNSCERAEDEKARERASRQDWAAEADRLDAALASMGYASPDDPLLGVNRRKGLPEISLDNLLAAEAVRQAAAPTTSEA